MNRHTPSFDPSLIVHLQGSFCASAGSPAHLANRFSAQEPERTSYGFSD